MQELKKTAGHSFPILKHSVGGDKTLNNFSTSEKSEPSFKCSTQTKGGEKFMEGEIEEKREFVEEELRVGDIIEVVLYEAKGGPLPVIGRTKDGKVILLNKYEKRSYGCKPGDVVRLKIISVGKSYNIGTVVEKVGVKIEFESKLMKIEGGLAFILPSDLVYEKGLINEVGKRYKVIIMPVS
jgi:hypothetical protein